MQQQVGRLCRQNRLADAADYQRVFQSGTKIRDRNFLVLAHKNNKLYSRVGLAISKKSIGSAVKRNRVKRIIREHFRSNQFKTRGLDIVVVANRSIHAAQGAELFRSLNHLWQRLPQCDPC